MFTDTEKLARIDLIVGEVINQRRKALPVEYPAVARKHPELMPELGQRLQRLQAIESAAVQAKTNRTREEFVGGADADLEFLRRAFPDCDTLERIDYGGQGLVFKAVQRSTKRTVALKILLDGALATNQQLRRFAREVELIARLRHPNIVTVHDSGNIQGRPFILMEYVDGLPIDDFTLVQELSVRNVVGLFRIVCQAVSTAHQNGIIHRDLKPANILVDVDGQPHVLDFGLAKDLSAPDEHSVISLTGQVVGTLPYLSPEQANGLNAQVDVRSDIYSLGVVLYELLVGERPYPVDGDRSTVLANILTREPLGLRKALARRNTKDAITAADINDDLERVVLRALEKEPSRRYQSADAFADDLGRYLAGDAVHAKSTSRLYLLRKAVRKFRVPVAIAASFVAVLLVAVIGMTLAWRRAERIGQIAMAGLDMGSLLKLGSVERDAGRIDQAVNMFAKVIEVGATLRSNDPLIQRQLFNAHHRVAELYLESRRTDLAVPHTEQAVRIARTMVAADAENPEWRCQLVFAHILEGRLAFAREAFENALASFTEANALQREILATEPTNPSLHAGLAYILGWQGWSARNLARYGESMRYYADSHAICLDLYAQEPVNPSRVVDLVRAENKLAAWHLAQKTEEDDQLALRWLQSAEERLDQLRKAEREKDRQWDVDPLADELEQNKRLVERRAANRNAVGG